MEKLEEEVPTALAEALELMAELPEELEELDEELDAPPLDAAAAPVLEAPAVLLPNGSHSAPSQTVWAWAVMDKKLETTMTSKPAKKMKNFIQFHFNPLAVQNQLTKNT